MVEILRLPCAECGKPTIRHQAEAYGIRFHWICADCRRELVENEFLFEGDDFEDEGRD